MWSMARVYEFNVLLPRPGQLGCVFSATIWLLLSLAGGVSAESSDSDSVRAVVPRAHQPIKIDGELREYDSAFSAPVEYFHPDLKNRAGQFFFLWDDEAFYVGLRTLDEKRFSPEHPLWEGDAVEWYFDTRRDATFLNREWGRGSVHCFFTPMHLDKLEPRFCLRPGYEDAIPELGIEVKARKTDYGIEAEFKLPWANFPDFAASAGEIIGIDAELSYSDGGPRSARSFVFGSPLSVQQPANLAQVQLVEDFQKKHWKSCGPVMMPVRVDVPWSQETRPRVRAMVALPPSHADDVSKVVFQTVDLYDQVTGSYEADQREVIEEQGNFVRLIASWPCEDAIPGRYHVRAIAYDKDDAELARVTSRLVSVNMQQGY